MAARAAPEKLVCFFPWIGLRVLCFLPLVPFGPRGTGISSLLQTATSAGRSVRTITIHVVWRRHVDIHMASVATGMSTSSHEHWHLLTTLNGIPVLWYMYHPRAE